MEDKESYLYQLRKMTDLVADTGDLMLLPKYNALDATTNPTLLLKVVEK